MAEVASSKVIPDSHLLLDQPLLKVPYELARKTHKTALRYVEREREVVLDALKSATNASVAYSKRLSHDELGSVSSLQADDHSIKSLDGMITKMESLKRKLETLHSEEQTNHRHARARIQHLQDLHEIPMVDDVKYIQWSKVRLDRLLVDYLLRAGYANSARELAKEVGIEELVDIEAFVQCSKIQASLQAGRTQEALSWCAENKQALKKINSDLEYELRLQQYIELSRSRQTPKLLEATIHAKKYLTLHSDLTYAIKAAALLAYPPETPIEPYKSLYSSNRYQFLTSLFLETHHSLLALPAMPPLYIALNAGLSALKTPSCHSAHAASSGNAASSTSSTSVCPICSTELNELARPVPYALHSKSSIEGDPVVLPNGRIYGRDRLLALNEKMEGRVEGIRDGDGRVRDPVTGDTWSWAEVKKVYIM